MRWPTLFCIYVTLAVTIADTNETDASPTESTTNPIEPSTNPTEPSTTPIGPNTDSNENARPKRHLSTLINIKKAILGKIFGSSASAKSYQLYRIPGHDNILVKAVPIQTPENDGEITIEEPANPTNAILESYLGTRTPNETLKALDGVKNLLESGIITNDALLNKLLVPVQPPKIVYRVPQISSVYPPVFRTPLPIEAQPGKPCDFPIPLQPRPVVVKTPLSLIPEAPVLPPLSSLPEVLVPPEQVLVEERPELLDIRRVEIPELRPVQFSKIPSNPFVQNGYEYLYKVPLVRSSLYPGSYSYEQFHHDGTVTLYTDTKQVKPVVRPAILPPAIVERVQVISEKIAPKIPVHVKVPGSGYSYHQVKNDGSITTYGSDGKIPQIVNLIPKWPRFPSVPVSLTEPIFLGKNPATYGPVRVEKIAGNPSGFSYHQYHSDGSVTLFGDGSKPLARPALLPSVVADRITLISDKMTGIKPQHVVFETSRTPEVLVKKPDGNHGYSYQQINNDGSVTAFTGDDGKKPLNVQVIKESPRLPTLHGSHIVLTKINTPEFGPLHVHKIHKNPNGFLYHQVHSDGSATTFTGSDVITPVVLPNIPDFTEVKRPEFGPVHVEKIPKNPNGFSYHQVNSGGSATTFTGSDVIAPVVLPNIPVYAEVKRPEFGPVHVEKIPKNPNGFSYHQVHSGGSATTFTGSDVAAPVVLPNIPVYAEVKRPEFGPVHVKKIPTKPNGFSYHQVHSDGSATTFTGSDVISPVVREPTLSTLFLNRPDVTDIDHPIYGPVRVEKIPKTPSGFSYHQVHTDGSETTHSGADLNNPPSYSTLFLNRPGFADIKHPSFGPIMHVGKLSNDNGKNPEQPKLSTIVPGKLEISKKPDGFSYQQVHNDGSVTTYTGSDVATPGSAGFLPTKPGNSGYSYHLIDDEVTISGLNAKRPAKIIDSHNNIQSTQQPVENSGYSYHQVSKGSTTTISGDADKATIPEPPKLSALINNKVTMTEVKTPQQISTSQGGFSYQQSNSGGFTGRDTIQKDSEKATQSDQLVIIGSVAGHGAQYVNAFDVSNPKELQNKPSRGFSYHQINSGGRVTKVESTEPQTVTQGDVVTLEQPTPCTSKCVATTKVTFPSPVVSTYEYQQLVRSNPNKKFTVVNIEDGALRGQQESTVSVSPITPSHVTRRPAHRRRTRPTSTESSLSENPIVVPEQSGFSYKQTSSDGSTTKIEGSSQHVTVSVSGEVNKTVHRGDIPE